MMLSPAKINLGLIVPFRRPDSYHQIASVFLRLNWGDQISFKPTEISGKGVQLVSENLLQGKPHEEFESVSERGDFTQNLLSKGFWDIKTNPEWRSLLPPSAWSHLDSLPGLNITLQKKIPTGGGLGGGSSNLGSLVQFLFPGLDFTQYPKFLEKISRLGADVPFFLQNKSAEVHGIGEILRPIEVGGGFGVLVLPQIHLSTKEMFQSLNKSLQEPPPSKVWEFLRGETVLAIRKGCWSSLRGVLGNDFESPAFQMSPMLSRIRDVFYQSGAEYSSMSGSGSALYGLVSSSESADSLWKEMRHRFPDSFVVRFSF